MYYYEAPSVPAVQEERNLAIHDDHNTFGY
jgi:hypothetical protein